MSFRSMTENFQRRFIAIALKCRGEYRMRSPRYTFPILAVVFFCVSVAWIYNASSRVIDKRHVDEGHVIVWGTPEADGGTNTVRVGEMNRLFVRLLYPVAIYYMNSHMGGEHYVTGWDYPGGYYLRDHFNRGGDAPGANKLTHASRDPELPSVGFHTVDSNIQDYVFFQRTAFGTLAVLSFLLLLFSLYSRYGFAAAATYAGLILFSEIVFNQFLIFYSETSLFIIFNLSFYFLISEKRIELWIAVLLGAVTAAALSTKLTGVLIAGPAFAQVTADAWGRGHRGTLIVGAFFASCLAVTVAINAHVASYFEFINETLANVYHYKTGHYVTGTGDYFPEIAESLGYGMVILFLVSSIYLALRPTLRDASIYALITFASAAMVSMANSALYMERNLAIIYVVMSFVVALGVARLVRSDRRGWRRELVAALCLSVFIVGAAHRVLAILPLTTSFFERNTARIADCGSIGVVGISEDVFRRFVDTDGAVFFEEVRGPFNLSSNSAHFDKYLAYDCVVALRRGQTKQITNFFAPQTHRLASRVGDLFFFDREALRRRPVVGM